MNKLKIKNKDKSIAVTQNNVAKKNYAQPMGKQKNSNLRIINRSRRGN